ncbi:hypothetical protein PENSUB_12834 [Penicillium subrubescens]|uniref:Uncharacterized protein n=1 Tax=Penicillium subrubescens TaxID=1316194 RepID=A0A1Q5SWE7_9EURO|nr:hypothetical protein PENSUB_12834 [Penicillium subrubescens]
MSCKRSHPLCPQGIQIPSETLENEVPEFCSKINPREPFTSMMVAQNCRLIMGPGRQGEVYGITALVPDEQMNEDPGAKQSWVSEGDLNKMLQTFSEFPTWVTNVFKHSADLGLWQLRDLGQGASQAIEDAEALGAFFEGISEAPSVEALSEILENIFQARYARVSLIQAYSREAAKPAAAKKTVTFLRGRTNCDGGKRPEASSFQAVKHPANWRKTRLTHIPQICRRLVHSLSNTKTLNGQDSRMSTILDFSHRQVVARKIARPPDRRPSVLRT